MLTLLLAVLIAGNTAAPPSPPLPGFRRSAWFEEQVRERWLDDGIRVVANAPRFFDPRKPTLLLVYATPNGNSIEQTLGCGKQDSLDWHYGIQHVAAQVRALRAITDNENIVLVCTEPEGLSWPAWKRKRSDGPARIRQAIETIRGWVPGKSVRVALTGHSGG